jgi:hypothetical protein
MHVIAEFKKVSVVTRADEANTYSSSCFKSCSLSSGWSIGVNISARKSQYVMSEKIGTYLCQTIASPCHATHPVQQSCHTSHL